MGAKEKDLEESVNLRRDFEQLEEAVGNQRDEGGSERELDDVSKEQIRKDILAPEEDDAEKSPEKDRGKKNSEWLDDSESSPDESGEEGQLAIDIYQTAGEIVIKSIVGGVRQEELDISINNDMVVIRGVRQNPDEVASEDYYYQECFWGNFARSVILPTEVDTENVEATIKNGILTVKLPKLKKAVVRKIEVKTV